MDASRSDSSKDSREKQEIGDRSLVESTGVKDRDTQEDQTSNSVSEEKYGERSLRSNRLL